MSDINEEYKDIKCIHKMDEKYKNVFYTLVDHYGEYLNKGCPVGKTLFTSHDFDKHCTDMYGIISNIVLSDENFKIISPKELFILNLAVLFHDISMATDKNCNRKKHSIESAQYIQDEFDNVSSSLHKLIEERILVRNDINSLKEIIKAHSDDKTDTSIDNGIFRKTLKEKMQTASSDKIRAKLLAAILRLADELDVTSDRLGSERYAKQLSSDDKNESESMLHWEKLHYFSSIEVNPENLTQLLLICDDDYLNATDNAANIVVRIKEVSDKIQKEINILNEEVFNKMENSFIHFKCNKVIVRSRLKFVNNEINDPMNKPLNTNNIVDKKKSDISIDTNGIDREKLVKIISQELNEKISREVNKRNLFSGGHYLINDKYCSRDYLNTHEIIETEKLVNECILEFVKHIKVNEISLVNTIIIGLDLEGSILAALLALELQLPFQYVIPAKAEWENSKHDTDTYILPDKDIILITDAICTYTTIESVISKFNFNDRVKAIYTVFYRNPSMSTCQKDSLTKITYAINDSFDMEIIEKEKCKHKGTQRCLAINKKKEKEVKNNENN